MPRIDRIERFTEIAEGIFNEIDHPRAAHGVFRRTFAAKNLAPGSTDRAKANLDPVTSEYMPSHKYTVKTKVGHSSYRTKAEADFHFDQAKKRGLVDEPKTKGETYPDPATRSGYSYAPPRGANTHAAPAPPPSHRKPSFRGYE